MFVGLKAKSEDKKKAVALPKLSKDISPHTLEWFNSVFL